MHSTMPFASAMNEKCFNFLGPQAIERARAGEDSKRRGQRHDPEGQRFFGRLQSSRLAKCKLVKFSI